eukprot:29127_1
MGCIQTTAPRLGENPTTQGVGEKTTQKRQRSGSMQYIWSASWTKLIGSRTALEMRKESSIAECNCNECNCVERAVFVMNIYKFWNDRKHHELDIDHIICVITEELTHYSKDQMLNDFKHCQASIGIDELNDLFQTKCKNCGGEACPVLQRKTQKANDDNVRTQRTSTLFRMNVDAIQLMNLLDDYHCYFLHKIDDIQGEEEEQLPPPPAYNPNARSAPKCRKQSPDVRQAS